MHLQFLVTLQQLQWLPWPEGDCLLSFCLLTFFIAVHLDVTRAVGAGQQMSLGTHKLTGPLSP